MVYSSSSLLISVILLTFATFMILYILLDAEMPLVAVPREFIRGKISGRLSVAEARNKKVRSVFWGSLLTLTGCSWCSGGWVSLGVVAMYNWQIFEVPTFWMKFFTWLAIWAGAGFLATLYDLVSYLFKYMDRNDQEQ